KSRARAARIYPAGHVFSPCTPTRRKQMPSREIVDVTLQRITVFNLAVFAREIVVGKSHVPRIAHDVNHSGIARIEIGMALDHARAGRTAHIAARLRFRIGYELLNIGEGYRRSGMHQVRDQEACPGIARSGIRNDKRVVGADGQGAPGDIQPERVLPELLDAVHHREDPFKVVSGTRKSEVAAFSGNISSYPR